MMRRFQAFLSGLLLISAFAAAPSSLYSAVIERDWKSLGDGLLTYDTVNKREWLDLNQTLLVQFPGTTLENRYQSVVAELALGGLFEGFTVAKSDDVIALAQSAGIDADTLDYGVNNVSVNSLADKVGKTITYPDNDYDAFAFLSEIDDFPLNTRSMLSLGLDYPARFQIGRAGIYVGGDIYDSNSSNYVGVWLYRTSVPEPTCLTYVIVFLIIPAAARPISMPN